MTDVICVNVHINVSKSYGRCARGTALEETSREAWVGLPITDD